MIVSLLLQIALMTTAPAKAESSRCYPRYAPSASQRTELLRSSEGPLSEQAILALALGPTPVGPEVEQRDVRRRTSAIWHVACRQQPEELQLLRDAREKGGEFAPYAYALAANGSAEDMEAFAGRGSADPTCGGTLGVAARILDLGDARGVPLWFSAFGKRAASSCVGYAILLSHGLATLGATLTDFDYVDAVRNLLEQDRELFGQLAVELLDKGARVEELRAASCGLQLRVSAMDGLPRSVQEAATKSWSYRCPVGGETPNGSEIQE